MHGPDTHRNSDGGALEPIIECTHGNPANGDTLQQTSTGLSFYRRSTNTPTFTDIQSQMSATETNELTTGR